MLVAQSHLTLCNSMDCSPQTALTMEFSFLSSGALLDPKIEPMFAALHLSHQESPL